jgi:sugar lactone lactonase YvrE
VYVSGYKTYNVQYLYTITTISCISSLSTLVTSRGTAYKYCREKRNAGPLKLPKGIALDQNKNVYVSGYKTNNVVILSPDGTNCRQILTKSDGLNGPFSLRIPYT